jgi:hypothetical protein
LCEGKAADLSSQKYYYILSKPPKVTFGCELGSLARYNITMENHYLSPKGHLSKKQILAADYTRAMASAITNSSVFLEFTWNSVNFRSEKWNGETSNLPLTFAQGLKFSHYRTFPSEVFHESVPVKTKSAYNIMSVDYSELAAMPSVNLLYMLSWDVTGFEEILSHLLGKLDQFTSVGKYIKLDTMSGTYAHLDFRDCVEDSSFFHNGCFTAAYLGMGAWEGKVGSLFEYKCVGELAVYNAKAKADATNQTGSSYYFGKLLVDIASGDLLRGDMTELITSIVVNKENKWVPQQKRRMVILERLGEKN